MTIYWVVRAPPERIILRQLVKPKKLGSLNQLTSQIFEHLPPSPQKLSNFAVGIQNLESDNQNRGRFFEPLNHSFPVYIK